jgi:hypothetical protein
LDSRRWLARLVVIKQYHHEQQLKKNEYHQIANGMKEGIAQSSYSTNVMGSVNITTIFGSDGKG